MDPALAPGTTPRPVVFQDGLGERRRISDVSGAETIEQLCLRSELTAIPSFEFALRERASRLANFRHVYYARVRSVDRLTDPASTLTLMSDSIKGVRLANLLAVSEKRPLTLDINASLHLIRQLVSAVAMLHETARDAAHGAIGPERIIVTPSARVVIAEYVLGAALEQLRFSQERCWRELRVALPSTGALPRFDHRADVTQIGVTALSLVIGRLLHEDEYPRGAGDVLALASAISSNGEHTNLPEGIRTWIGRALQLDAKHSFATAIEARDELDRALSGEDEGSPTVAVSQAPTTSHHAVESHAEPIAARHKESERAPIYVPPSAAAAVPAPAMFAPPAAPAVPAAAVPAAPASTPSAATPSAAAPPFDALSFLQQQVAAPAPASNHQAAARPTYEAATHPPLPRPSAPPQSEYEPEVDSEEQAAGRPIGKIAAVALAVIALSGAGLFAGRKYFAGPAAAATGTLSINTNPPGAEVVVDGQSSGVTPVTLTLKPGAHNVELRGGGEPRTVPVTITAGTQVSQYIELPKAITAFGQLQIRTEPAGAVVTVDGIPRGKSPVLIESLAAGEHAVSLETDVANVKQTVQVEAGQTASLVVPLGGGENAPVSGWMSVAAPVELQLFEKGRLLGSSQSERVMISAGKHEIELVNEPLGYRVVRTIQVAPGKVAPIKVEWPKGSIAINALPWADVYIDGERVGETPIGNLQLAIGPHEILFRHPELGEQRYATTVSLKAPARVSVDLRKK
jgi:hypothetical protein